MMAHNHNHEHSHSHGDHHGHSHAPASFGRAFAIGTALNLGVVIVEAVYGYLAHSLALFADGGSQPEGCVGTSPGVQVPSRRPPTPTPMGYTLPQSWRLWGKVAQLFAAATRTLKLLLCNSFRKICGLESKSSNDQAKQWRSLCQNLLNFCSLK